MKGLTKSILISIMLFLSFLCLCACTPKSYTDEMLKQYSEDNEQKAREWFSANLPQATDISVETIYTDLELYNIVSGHFAKDGDVINYVLNPYTGVCYTSEYYALFEDTLEDNVAQALGVDASSLSFSGSIYEIEAQIIKKTSGTDKYLQSTTYPVSEALLWTLSKSDVIALAGNFDNIPTQVFNLYLDSLDDVEATYGDLNFLTTHPNTHINIYKKGADKDSTYYVLAPDKGKSAYKDRFVLMKYEKDQDNKWIWTVISEMPIDEE